MGASFYHESGLLEIKAEFWAFMKFYAFCHSLNTKDCYTSER